jgi:prepilin-type N-terminal cleavage/methylation domain-containing protein
MSRRRDSADGFTLIEMVIAISLGAMVFASLAALMGSGIKTLSIEKARAQANEVATQAIEDLQRFDYDHLGVCATAPDPPSDLTDPAVLANCPTTGQPAGWVPGQPSTAQPAPPYEQPCAPSSGTVPMTVYDCTANNRTYHVTRYVAWGDAAQSQKRLAVFVTWTDQVGSHQVSEQSSLRSPSPASLIGIAPPSFASATVNPSQGIALGTDGSLQTSVNFTAQTSGLSPPASSGDQVTVTFMYLIPPATGQLPAPAIGQVELTSGDGVTWTGSLPAGAPGQAFGAGSQYFSFSAVRASDGKASAAFVAPASTFSCASCASQWVPSFQGSAQVPASIAVDTSGLLYNPFTVSVTTVGVTAADQVTVNFQTLGGHTSQQLNPDASCPSTSTSTSVACTWTTTITPASGFRFPPGPQHLYFVAAQIVSSDAGSIDVGATAGTASSSVVFG